MALPSEVSVGNATVQLTATSASCSGLRIYPPNAGETPNNDSIKLVVSSLGLPSDAATRLGYNLDPANYEGIFIECADQAWVYAISASASQRVRWAAVSLIR